MKREFGFDQIVRDDRSVVTVGTFDGVHRGHQSIIEYLMGRARQLDGVGVAVSFDPHPREVITGEPVPLLTTIEERAEALEALGLDRFIVLPFTREFAEMTPEAFVEDVLIERIGLREIVVGYDHGFGKGRKGDHSLLRRLGERHGFSVDVVPAQVLEKDVISSSRIRRVLMAEGDVALARTLLGRPYRLSGTVVAGDHRGRELGFPTANLRVNHPAKVIPRAGVYAVYIRIDGGAKPRAGMMNIGHRPTFDGREERMEVHLFDFDEPLYRRTLTVDFIRRIRDERKFSSPDALVEQLSNDERRCRAILESVT